MIAAADLADLKSAVNFPALVAETSPIVREGRGWKTCCPFHGEHTPSLHIYGDHYHCYGCGAHGDPIDWLRRARGMSFAEAIRHLGGDTGDKVHRQNAPPPKPPPRPEPAAETMPLAKQLWREGVTPTGTLVEAYLRNRGLKLPDSPAVRFHPAAPRGDERLPAMLALMTNSVTNLPCGVHRTFVLPDGSGKAPGKAKMMLGNAGIVRLVPDNEVTTGLGLAEGIETALAVMQIAGWRPVWAATSAGSIAKFQVLSAIECLTIFADADDSGVGLRAARECAARWGEAGRAARIQIPPPEPIGWTPLRRGGWSRDPA
jgi:hypothetical protein